MTMEETEGLKTELTNHTKTWWDKFNKVFSRTYEYPAIEFNLTGTKAGEAHYQKHYIRYNIEIYRNNKEVYGDKTVPHEIAHLFTYRMHMLPYRRWDVKPHGREWGFVMGTMGLSSKRCHEYKVERVWKVNKPYIYTCKCGEYKLSAILHKRISAGGYRKCLKCGMRVVFKGVDVPTLTKEELMSRMEEDRKKLELLEVSK